jgi:hypothetical protein
VSFFPKKFSSSRPETSTRQKRKKLFSSHRRRYHSEHPDQLPRAGSWRHREERGEVARPRGEGRGRGGEAEDFGVALELPARFFFEVFIVEVRLSELLSRCSLSLSFSLSLSLSLFLSLFLSLSFSPSLYLFLVPPEDRAKRMTIKRRRRNKRRVLSRKDRDDVCVAVEPKDFLIFFGSFFLVSERKKWRGGGGR